MHITELRRYPICTYPELLLIEKACIQMGPLCRYAVKRIMHLCDMHLSGVDCITVLEVVVVEHKHGLKTWHFSASFQQQSLWKL